MYMKHITFLLLTSCIVSIYAKNGFDAELFDAIRSENPDPEVVHDLLQTGANPNAQQDGETAIMVAIRLYKPRIRHSILEELINKAKKDKSLNFIADNKMTALTFAALLYKPDVIELLFRYGAKRNQADGFGHTMDYYMNLSEEEREQERFNREFVIIERPKEEPSEEEPWTIIG